MDKITQQGDKSYLINLDDNSTIEWSNCIHTLYADLLENYDIGEKVYVTTSLCNGMIIEKYVVKVTRGNKILDNIGLHCETGPAWIDKFRNQYECWYNNVQYTPESFCKKTGVDEKNIALWNLKYK